MPDNTNFQEHLEVVAKDFQERAGGSGELMPDQEKKIIKEIVKEKYSPPIPASSAAAAQPSDDNNQNQSSPGPVLTHGDLSKQYQSVVDGFIQDALAGDLTKVVQEVNHSNNPWVIDQFHDVLVDKFYSEIKARRQNAS